MPSLNRPNAPNRLPSSDFGNLFGRPRALRASDPISPNDTPSPLSTPNNYIAAQRRALRSSESGNANPVTSSPLASPSSPVARQRPKLERRGYYSDINVISPYESNNIPSSSNEIPLIVEEEPVRLKNRTASDTSSISSRARRLLGFPAIRITPGAGNEQPPSKATSGFKWKRGFSGRWLEIRIGRKGQSAEHSAQASGEATPIPLSHRSSLHFPLSQASTVLDPEGHDRRQSNAASNQRLLLPESRDPLQPTALTPKEGLYCRTKRALGLKHDPMIPTDAEPLDRTSTDNLLDRVTSTLRFLPAERKTTPSPSSATSVSNLSIATPRWQRILHQSHHGKINPSTTSSIRSLMMGKPPLHTPEPEALYTASDDQKYLAVDLTDDGKSNIGITFLPSEARRIHTPPLPSADHHHHHHHHHHHFLATSPGAKAMRGFFFDYNAPTLPERPAAPMADAPSSVNASLGDHANASASTTGGSAAQQDQQQQQRRRDSDWYRVKMNAIIDAADDDDDNNDNDEEEEGKSDATMARAKEREQQLALFCVPEHLPNSPLCPRHPRYRSGGRGRGRGRGECPFHGRSGTGMRKEEGEGMSPRTSPLGERWW